MEMSVGFTDKDEAYYTGQGYSCDESVMGKVYYPKDGVEITGTIGVRYMEYPWISTFEFDGIYALPPEPKKKSGDKVEENE